MKVEQQYYLKKKALVILPETLQEKEMLKRCLGSKSPIYVIGVFDEVESPDLQDRVILWDDSQNRSECLPEQDGAGPGIRVVMKKADLGDFMNALRRYINVIIDYRFWGDAQGEEERLRDKIHEASQNLQKILKPLFGEEVH